MEYVNHRKHSADADQDDVINQGYKMAASRHLRVVNLA